MVGFSLTRCKEHNGAYDVRFGVGRGGGWDQDSKDALVVLIWEALRQQMGQGSGPSCLYHHAVGEECPLKEILQLCWDYVETDPEIAGDPDWNWKAEDLRCLG